MINNLKKTRTRAEEEALVKKFLRPDPAFETAFATTTLAFSVFDRLNPAKHVVPMTFIMWKAMQKSTNAADHRFCALRCADLLRLGDWTQKKISKIPKQFFDVCRTFSEISVKYKLAQAAVVPLERALMAVTMPPNQFTSIHVDYVFACLSSKNYSRATLLLDMPLLSIESMFISMSTTPEDLMRYFYYGGRIYIGVKKFDKALEFFKHAIAVPANCSSTFVVEAFSYYVVLSLMLHGKVEKSPKYASPYVQRYRLPAVLKDMATMYESGQLLELAELLTTKKPPHIPFGLIKQSLHAMNKRQIAKQTGTYLTIPLAELANILKTKVLDNVEEYLLEMIEAGELEAVIDQEKGMVVFGGSLDSPCSDAYHEKMTNQLQELANHIERLKDMDDKIAGTGEYLLKSVQRASGPPANHPTIPGDSMDF